ncbi:MAG: hypothetical protein RIR00_910 [Pseudomonadota bacterium]
MSAFTSSSAASPASAPVPPIRILSVVLIYATGASLWILLSDRLVQWLFPDPARMLLASTLKGWFFVAVTSLLLYWLIRRLHGGGEQDGIRRLSWPQLPLWLIALAVLVLVGVAGSYSFGRQHDKQTAVLRAMAELKAGQVGDWLRERQADAEFIQSSSFVAELYRQWQAGDAGSGERLRARLEQFRQNRGFSGSMLVDANQKVLWHDGLNLEPGLRLRAALAESLRDGRTRRVGPYLDQQGAMHLDVLAPLAGNVRGVMVMHADPEHWLFPTLRIWPLPNVSGGIDLLSREGDSLLVLNAVQPDAGGHGVVRIPLDSPRLAAKLWRNGQGEDAVSGLGANNQPVLGLAQKVPQSDWVLVARMDRDEFYGEAIHDIRWISLAGLLALFILGVSVVLLRQQDQLEAGEQLRGAQVEQLQTLQLLNALAGASEDAIFARDKQGAYLLLNQAAARLFGVEAAALLGQQGEALLPAPLLQRLRQIDQAVLAGEARRHDELLLQHAGQDCVLDLTSGPLLDGDGRVVGVYGLARDITARKEHEAALQRSERRFRDIAQVSADWIWEIDPEGRYTYASGSVFELLGYTEAEILGKTPFDFMPPDEARRVKGLLDDLQARRLPFRDLDNLNLRKDGSLRYIQTNGTPIFAADGRFLGYRGLDRDVSDRKETELALRQQTESLAQRNAELERFNRAMVDRELNMIELKREINRLSQQAGAPLPYPLAYLSDERPLQSGETA